MRKLTQKRLTAVTRINELVKWWNKNSKKTSADELAKVWEELKNLAPVTQDRFFIQANEKTFKVWEELKTFAPVTQNRFFIQADEKTLWVDEPIINNDIFLNSKFETFSLGSYNGGCISINYILSIAMIK